ncbi:hypothetical protein SAMN06265338_13017 [Rhodoblastus acidophilus]|uniref:Uncharacterized protein n=1 Tax=Rhodoblastus acidophilus TaxID=1074 RepID=A0A212SE41_RHOAC|nr:hypothetical protein [Rhodoblastus acidophilus]PPQ34974.1 hypothetical protein CKO16_21430 [Rhodoblastus acidophilus]RAI16818.1 hypothetical protein CH337_19470 [Rhodoblastus acidophilus]SNB83816.1 hypothetical protein SAMN06265338_13017 [Rhodoblastus acidophilus]
MERKFLSSAVTAQAGDLGERQIKVIASDPTRDRAGDILVPSGCVTSGYAPIQLDHEATIEKNAGGAKITVTDSRVEALITFLDEGKSDEADGACYRYKAGILKDVSVGFKPIEWEPIKGGGVRYTKWELLELSLVVVACNPAATTIERSNRSGRVDMAQLRRRAKAAELAIAPAIPKPAPKTKAERKAVVARLVAEDAAREEAGRLEIQRMTPAERRELVAGYLATQGKYEVEKFMERWGQFCSKKPKPHGFVLKM